MARSTAKRSRAEVAGAPARTGGSERVVHLTDRAAAPASVPAFVPPALRPGLVEREALIGRLEESDASVVVVSAPGGYGKTTLVAQWAARTERRVAWLDASALVGDVLLFLEDLAGALGAAGVPVAAGPEPADGATSPSRVLQRLARAVRAAPGPAALVIDDAGRLADPLHRQALQAVAESVAPGIRVVLACRSDPPIGVAALRAGRRLDEIGVHDLAMDAAAARGVLGGLGVRLDDAALGSLVERTEGWPAGLVLAGLAVRDHPDPGRASARVAGSDRRIADYFAEEVLQRAPIEETALLVRTSVLDVLTPGACSAVTGATVTGEDLRRLARDSQFVVQLDERGEHFRHHQLFAEMLRDELARREPEDLPVLHSRAAGWYEARGDAIRAVRHLIAAGDLDGAAALVWRCVATHLHAGRIGTVRLMLRAFPAEELRARAPLALAMAWSCIDDRGHLVAHWTRVAAAAGHEGPLPGGPSSLAAAVALLDAAVGADGILQAGRDAELAYESDDEDSPWRALACFHAGVAAHLSGDPDRGRHLLREGSDRAGAAMPVADMLCQSWLAVMRLLEGGWAGARVHEARAREEVRAAGLQGYSSTALLDAITALLAAHDGDDETARASARRACTMLVATADLMPWYGVASRILLARAAMQVGEDPWARTLIREAGEDIARVPDAPALVAECAGCLAAIEGLPPGNLHGSGSLTTAELRVLNYLPTHLTFRQIGERMHLSRFTIKSQALSGYRKLGVVSRSEAVSRARALGLLDPEH